MLPTDPFRTDTDISLNEILLPVTRKIFDQVCDGLTLEGIT